MVNEAKNKVMRYVGDGIVWEMNIVMDGQVLQEVEVFKYLRSPVMAAGGVETEVQQMVLDDW